MTKKWFKVWLDWPYRTTPEPELIRATSLYEAHLQNRDRQGYHHTEPDEIDARIEFARLCVKTHSRLGQRANYETGI